jgi:hypothetical protein
LDEIDFKTAGLSAVYPKNTTRIITKTHNITPALIRNPIIAVRSDDVRYSFIGALQRAEWPAATALVGLFEVPRMPKARDAGFLILLPRSFEPASQIARGTCDVYFERASPVVVVEYFAERHRAFW